jgi:hypothetical protein
MVGWDDGLQTNRKCPPAARTAWQIGWREEPEFVVPQDGHDKQDSAYGNIRSCRRFACASSNTDNATSPSGNIPCRRTRSARDAPVTKRCEPAASLQHFDRMGKPRMEASRLHRVQHISNMIVARNLRHPKQRLAVRATVAAPVLQVPLMGQERRALHEKRRKRRHADIGHDVMAVFPVPLVRQTRTGGPQPRYQDVDRSHTALESDSSRPEHCPNVPRFNQSHPPQRRAPRQNENCCCVERGAYIESEKCYYS